MSKDTIPLPLLAPGCLAEVSRVANCGHHMARRLAAMGITPGTQVTLLSSQGGPLVLRVGQSRIAIGRRMAHRVIVHPCD